MSLISNTEKQKPKRIGKKTDVEKELESFIFGEDSAKDFRAALSFTNFDTTFDPSSDSLNNRDDEVADNADEALDFFIDETGLPDNTSSNKVTNSEEKIKFGADSETAAWVDDDDEEEFISLTEIKRIKKLRETETEDIINGSLYQERLRKQYKSSHQKGTWADIDKVESDEEDFSVFRRVGGLIDQTSTRGKIDPKKLSYDRVSDLTCSENLKGEVRFLEFHPLDSVVIAAGPEDPIRLFRLDGKKNSLLRQISLQDFPLTSATFAKAGSEIIATSTSSQFYTIDTETGEYDYSHLSKQKDSGGFDKGVSVSPNSTYFAFLSSFNSGIIIASGKTKMLIGTLKLPVGRLESAVWDPQERFLYTLSSTSEVFVWDPRKLRCTNRFKDYGGFKATSIAISPDGNFLSIGSKTGILNVYNVKDLNCSEPKPIKEVTNLTTSIDNVAFNHDSQLMCFSSREKKDQAKLFHLASQSVVANWPAVNTPLKKVTSVAFSPTSSYLALGNTAGKIPLFCINPYMS